MTEHTHHARDNSALYIPGAIVIAGLVIGVSLIVALRPVNGVGTATGSGQPTVAVNIKDVKIDGEPFIGNPKAKVVIAFWSDFQCPYCKAVETGGIPQITTPAAIPDVIKNYVDTGKVKIVFKDYPFLGEDSITTAVYARAVWKLYPEKYFEVRTAMYLAQDEEGDEGFGDEASIMKLLAGISGVDAQRIQADVSANRAGYVAATEANRAEGASFGITGTPGFITGKTLIPGAVGYDQFKTALDAQL